MLDEIKPSLLGQRKKNLIVIERVVSWFMWMGYAYTAEPLSVELFHSSVCIDCPEMIDDANRSLCDEQLVVY
jgi:hypothetical protein